MLLFPLKEKFFMRLKTFVKNKLLKQKPQIEQRLDLRKFMVPNKTGNLFDYEYFPLTKESGLEISTFLTNLRERFPRTFRISLDLEAIVKAQKIAPNFAKIEPFFFFGDICRVLPAEYYTLQFGCYPLKKTYAAIRVDSSPFTLGGMHAKPTQKTYVGYTEVETKDGRRYAIEEADEIGDRFEIHPLRWTIVNYDDLPKELNPKGTGKAKTIELASGKVVPTYYSNHDKNGFLEEALVVSPKFMKTQGVKNVNALTRYINKIKQHNIQTQNSSEMSK